MDSRKLTYAEFPSAYLVAGRRLAGRFTDNGFDEFCGWLDEIAAEVNEPLVVIPAGNFCGTGSRISETSMLSCALGLLVASADTEHVSSTTGEDIVAMVGRAKTLPWERITELVSFSGCDGPKGLQDELALYATATGPLAGVMIGYGVLVALRPEDEEWDYDVDEEQEFVSGPNSVAAIVPGLSIMRGNLLDQSPQPNAIYGVTVEQAFYDEPRPVSVDVSAKAHASRVAALGELSAQSAYHLIAHYD
ncbi:MAG: hypothetical protein JOY82_23300 [Streptosporangiaceae bacterium]|nr:hypothetical protein [Streptosporangiaceae bacterium]MBV9857409.1 hypothetical protein [Streptosporangiaceae bacterium]